MTYKVGTRQRGGCSYLLGRCQLEPSSGALFGWVHASFCFSLADLALHLQDLLSSSRYRDFLLALWLPIEVEMMVYHCLLPRLNYPCFRTELSQPSGAVVVKIQHWNLLSPMKIELQQGRQKALFGLRLQ